MENIVRTVYNSYIETVLLLDLDFNMVENTTLNEKFGVQSGIAPGDGVIPSLKYFAIGNGGHKLTIGSDGLTKTDPVQHRATDAALYNHIPFVLRELTNDIDAVERAKYALRRKETYNGITYVAYYLKRLDLTDVNATTEYINITDGVQVVSGFTPNSSNLNPTPPELSSTGTNVASGDYVSATAKVAITFTADEVTELLNVANVMYSDSGYAIISEIALCTGVDKTAQSPAADGATINVNEAISVQVASFINTFFSLPYTNEGCNTSLDIGVCEPILNIS